jgi:hypothetical protein
MLSGSSMETSFLSGWHFSQVHQNFIFYAARGICRQLDAPLRAEGVDRLDEADGPMEIRSSMHRPELSNLRAI